MSIEQIKESNLATDVLDRAKDRPYAEVIVIGWSKDTEKLMIETNCGRNMEIHWSLRLTLYWKIVRRDI